MAVTITAPTSRVVGRSGGVRVAWTPEYPQSAYEVLYRRKGEQAWNTFGRVASGEHSAQLDLSPFDDFSEYHYRVVCYSENAASGTTIYSGSDSSAAYSLIVVPENRLAAVKIRYGNEMVEVPIYEDVTTSASIRAALPEGKHGEIPLGDTDSALASELRVRVNGETLAALGAEGLFADSGVRAGAYMAVKERYQYSYSNPTYYYKYRYSYTNPVYYYSYRYSYTNPTYYYAYKYEYVQPTYYYYRYSYTNPTYYYKTQYSYTTPVTYHSYVYSYAYYLHSAYRYSDDTQALAGGTTYPITPAGYKYAYGYYKTGGETAYGYKYVAGGGDTGYGYAWDQDSIVTVLYRYKYKSGGGGTGYGYEYSSEGGETGYGYRYRSGGGGTGYGYRYATTYRYA